MKRVGIIGGGLAGLACALRLQRAGVDCVVFEASAVAGRRCRHSPYLLGSEVYPATFRLIEELGLDDRLIPIRPDAGQYYRGRISYHAVSSATGLLGFQGLHILDKAMLPRMAYLLAKYRSKLDIRHPERGVDLDDESAAAFVKRELSQNILNYIAGPLISTLFFFGAEETSKLLYLNIARHMHNTRMSTLRGGLGQLCERLAQAISPRLNSPVRTVRQEGPVYVMNGETFSDLVVAVEAPRVLGIEGIAALLSPQDRSFFESSRYQRTLSLTVESERPVDSKCYAVSIPRAEQLSALTIAFIDFIDPDSVEKGKGRLIVTGGSNATAEILMKDLSSLYPAQRNLVISDTFESFMPMFPPGRYREIRAFQERSRPAGLFFCGDYWLGPFLEGAVCSGFRAADAVLKELQNK